MPDLDQLLDTLVTDVSARTRAPGAPRAIQQAHRRRVKVAAAMAAGAVAFIAVGGGLAAGTLGGSDQVAPIGEPTTPSPQSPTVQESAEASPGSDEFLVTELRKTLLQVPDWAITDNDPAVIGSCGGDWSKDDTGGGGGIFGSWTPGWNDERQVVTGGLGFPSPAQASDAADRLVENLASCKYTAWRTQPIAQTGAVLASSADGVVWIQQNGVGVSTLEVPTTDGPPPLDVQVEVAEWMVADMIHSRKDKD